MNAPRLSAVLGAAALAGVLAAASSMPACGGSEGTPTPSPSPSDTTCRAVSGNVTAEGVSIFRPTGEPRACSHLVTTEGESSCVEKAADLSCLGVSDPRTAPINVTMRGCVSTFGVEGTSSGLSVTLLREKDAGGAAIDPGYDVAGAPGMQANTTPSAVIGRTISTEVPRAQCPDQGYFEIPNVPTETDLIARVTHENLEKGRRDLVDVYQYNILLRTADIVDANGAKVADPATTCRQSACFVERQVNTIRKSTYITISRAAGVSSVVGESDLYDGNGQGHIAGEIRDCTTSTQTSLQNAAVAIDASARKLTYFNVGFPGDGGDLDDPKPSSTRQVTNADGLYLALAVDTMRGGRPVTVGAAVTPSIAGPDGIAQCTSDGKKNPAWTAADTGEAQTRVLATRRVFVFPDSVTILTFDRQMYTASR
jgi:hypothetical protein